MISWPSHDGGPNNNRLGIRRFFHMVKIIKSNQANHEKISSISSAHASLLTRQQSWREQSITWNPHTVTAVTARPKACLVAKLAVIYDLFVPLFWNFQNIDQWNMIITHHYSKTLLTILDRYSSLRIVSSMTLRKSSGVGCYAQAGFRMSVFSVVPNVACCASAFQGGPSNVAGLKHDD